MLSLEYFIDTKEFIAHHFDEEKFEENLLLEDKNNQFYDDILLFDEYNLTREEFNKFKEAILAQV